MSPNERPTDERFVEASPKPSDSRSGRERVASQRKTVPKAHSLIDKVYSWDNLSGPHGVRLEPIKVSMVSTG